MAAILAGWCSSVLSPCRSPAKIWIGVTSAAIHIAIENMIRAWRSPSRRSRCSAPTAPTAKAVVRKAASTVCTSRYGNEGLKMICSQSAGAYWPTSLIT